MNNYIDPAGKLLNHIDRIAAIKAGNHPAPVNVEIDLSNRCNLGCKGCHFAYTHTRGPLANSPKPGIAGSAGDLFDYPLIIDVLFQLKCAAVRSVVWTGGGEPTLYPQFAEVVKYAAEHKLAQGMYTNGTLMNDATIELVKQNMEWVYISLDRHEREAYRAYKQVDAFGRADERIRKLVKAKGKATVGIGFLLSADNWKDVPGMIDYWRGTGADYVQFRPQIDYYLDAPNQSVETDWIREALPQLEMARHYNGVIVDIDRFKMYAAWKRNYHTCYWTQMQTVITPDARLWVCVNRRGFDGDALGDLHEEPFEDIWERSFAKIVDRHCRIMCRGHIPNVTLNTMIEGGGTHQEFI